MSGPQFFETRAGRQFYEATMPELVRQLKRIADGVERIVVALEANAEPEDDGDRDA